MPDILHALLGSLKELPAKRWKCSIDGITKGPVIEHKMGLEDGVVAWTRFIYQVDGNRHDLRIERTVNGDTTVSLDQQPKDNGSFDIHPTTVGVSAVLVVKAHYVEGQVMHEVRFDGRMWP